MKRFIARRGSLVAAGTVLGSVGVVLVLLSTGSLAFGHDTHHASRVSSATPQTPNPHDVTAANASDSVVRGRLSVRGIAWTASTYTSSLGNCLEIGAGQESVGGCGSSAPGSFTWGIGTVEVGGTDYNVAHGYAPPDAASLQVVLADGSSLPSSQRYVGNRVWFAAYPATVGQQSDDVSKVELLNAAGDVIDSVSPPSISAYENEATKLAGGGSASP